LADEGFARVLAGLLGILVLDRGRARQESPALQFQERGGHDDKLARQFDVQALQPVEVGDVLVGNPRNRQVAHVHLLPPNQVQQEVHRTVVHLQIDFVRHGMRLAGVEPLL